MLIRNIWVRRYRIEKDFTIASLNHTFVQGDIVGFEDPFLTIDGRTTRHAPHFKAAIEKKWAALESVLVSAPPPPASPEPSLPPGSVTTTDVDGVPTTWVVPTGRWRFEFLRWLSSLPWSRIRTATSDKFDLTPFGWIEGQMSTDWIEWGRSAAPIELEF